MHEANKPSNRQIPRKLDNAAHKKQSVSTRIYIYEVVLLRIGLTIYLNSGVWIVTSYFKFNMSSFVVADAVNRIVDSNFTENPIAALKLYSVDISPNTQYSRVRSLLSK